MKYIKKTLENGLTIALVPIPKMNIVTMGFFIGAGSRNEMDQNSGVAHFLEHLMFKGTTHRSVTQLFNELDLLAANYNAVTTMQSTYYYLQGKPSDLKKLLDIILDIYINPQFDMTKINREKKIIIEEMRMRSDLPLIKLYYAIHKKIFEGTSLARPVIGTAETVESFNIDDFINFRKAMYQPENTIFVIVGNFNPVPVYRMVSRVLKPLKNADLAVPTYFHEKNIILENMYKQDEPYVFIKKNKLYQQVYMMLAFPMYDLYDTQSYEINLLSYLLSSGYSSRLNQALRENNGITYTLSTFPIAYNDVGLFIIQTIINPNELTNGISILMEELRKVKNKPISEEEMDKIINITKNESIYALMRPMEILTFFGLNFLKDRNFKPELEKEFRVIEKITREQVQKTANEIFLRDKINLFIYGNTDETNFDFINL